MMYLLGIDLGTSACKAALFAPDGTVLKSAAADYPIQRPRAGWAEQSPDAWWAAAAKSVQEVLTGTPPARVAGVGVDGQSWSAVAIDRAGAALCNTPIWMDVRAKAICDHLEEVGLGEVCFQTSGNPLKPSYTLPKLLWYQQHAPEIYRQTWKILQSNGWIVYRLTRALTQDASQGYGYGCFDMQRGRWDEALARALGISPALLPEICACHQVVGHVTAEAARATGLLAGTPVVAGGLDAACAALGAGVHLHGQAQEQGGQAGGMSIALSHMIADRRLILSRHVVPGLWLLQGGTVGGGGALKWLAEQLCAAEGALAAAHGGSIFEQMNLAAERVPAGSNGVLFLPYMAGERSPIWDEAAKGVYYGLSYACTRADMIRACMEGVAYSLQHNLRTAAEAGAGVQSLHAMGGSANSLLFTQIKSDVVGLPIDVPSSDTATTLGAAMLAGVGVGLYADFGAAVRQTVRVTRRHEPNAANEAVYRRGYARYRALYEQLKMMMREDAQPCK